MDECTFMVEPWNQYTSRFSIIAQMACDILFFPISMIVSKLTFSISGHIVDDRRWLKSLRVYMIGYIKIKDYNSILKIIVQLQPILIILNIYNCFYISNYCLHYYK